MVNGGAIGIVDRLDANHLNGRIRDFASRDCPRSKEKQAAKAR